MRKPILTLFTLTYIINIFQDRCERILEHINIATEEKINEILEAKMQLLKKAMDLQKSGDMSALALKASLDEARNVATLEMSAKEYTEDTDRVTLVI